MITGDRHQLYCPGHVLLQSHTAPLSVKGAARLAHAMRNLSAAGGDTIPSRMVYGGEWAPEARPSHMFMIARVGRGPAACLGRTRRVVSALVPG